MERKLKALFDYQRFEGDPRLKELIEATESYYVRQLTDEELGFVNAAGEFSIPGGTISGNDAQTDAPVTRR